MKAMQLQVSRLRLPKTGSLTERRKCAGIESKTCSVHVKVIYSLYNFIASAQAGQSQQEVCIYNNYHA
jgi:hypothetical protein